MLRRWVEGPLSTALADRPVVFLHGARQTGKSTLAQHLARTLLRVPYLTCDDAIVLGAASRDPAGFIAGAGPCVVLDEVQRVPGIALAIKLEVDRDRRPGRFLLTGSANVLVLPRLADALVGRMEILTLWPLSQGEIAGQREGFVDAVFGRSLPAWSTAAESRSSVVERLLRGGYPEPLTLAAADRRAAWFRSYVTTIVQRDVPDVSRIEDLSALPRLLSLLAARSSTLVNVAEIARSLAMPHNTVKRYMAILEAAFLVMARPAWSANLGKRTVKARKLSLIDTGLTAALLGVTAERLAEDGRLLGALLEDFVATELRKQIGWSRHRAEMFHWRTAAGAEVDIVLEEPDGSIVGIEVKASATVGPGDFSGLRALQGLVGSRFRRGILLHLGREIVPVGPALHAMPVHAVWDLGGEPSPEPG